MIFAARYRGTCGDCGGVIQPGELVEYRTGDLCHVKCEPNPDDLRPGEVVCQECWLVKPCGCDS